MKLLEKNIDEQEVRFQGLLEASKELSRGIFFENHGRKNMIIKKKAFQKMTVR